MVLRPGLLIFFTALTMLLRAQQIPAPTCAQKEFTLQLYRQHPQLKQKHDAIEKKLYQYKTLRLGRPLNSFAPTNNPVVLPVVVHIVHNNGPENISDAQVKQAIEYLNQAYAASGYYNNGNSTNTGIQFCMAQRDPEGNATSGITRNVSRYTVMGGSNYASDDEHIKSINPWNPYNYINIWLVNSIPGDVVGYSTLPEAHGTPYEGIVMEAEYFGGSQSKTVVLVHEIGHFLGMYHTFDGGCPNKNCLTDGDMVCDTPPDQSTAYIGCDASMNSCTTDTQSGFNTDQNDLTQDYMDYGNFDCMKVFTPGQTERMNWFIQNELFSLLNCNSCKPPCLTPVTANYAASTKTAAINTAINFTNHSENAAAFKWLVDGAISSTTKDLSKAFTTQGKHIITLRAFSDDPLCDSSIFTDTVMITCKTKAGFTLPAGVIKMNQHVNFTNTAVNANSFVWKINGVTKGSSAGFTYIFPAAGIYTVTQLANGECTDSVSQQVSVYDSAGHIPQDICKPVTFQKVFTTNNQLIWGMNITKDSGYILCGDYAVPFVDGYGGSYAVKLSKAGGVEWARYINPQSDELLEKIYENADGTFIACGREYKINSTILEAKAILIKLDAKGNVMWAKKMGLQNSVQDVALDVTATSDGGFAFCGAAHNDDFRLSDWLVVKTDANGNIMWSKTMDNGFYDHATGIVATGDTLVVSGIRTLNTGPRSEIVITKMLASTGRIIQSWTFDADSRSVENVFLYKTTGGYLVGAESVKDGFYYADMDQLALQLDENLQPVRVAKVAIDIFGSPATGLNPTSDGGFVTARISQGFSNYEQTDSSWMAIAKITPDWKLDWIKKYPLAASEGHTVYMPRSVFPTLDGGYITGQTTTKKDDYGEHFRLIKTDSKGNTPGCPVQDFQAEIQTPVLANEAFVWPAVNDVVLNNPVNTTLQITDNKNEDIKAEQRCATSDCDYIKLKGSPKICSLSDTVTYSVDRNAACVSSVLWLFDTTIAAVAHYTDTTISLYFKQTGITNIKGVIFTACTLLQDSIVISVNDNTLQLNLGPDIQLCTGSTVKLSAGKGFKTYSWNTGSTDSTLTVYTPGQYYVTTTDNCGDVLSDTVLISLAPQITLNLSAQLPRCDADSVKLTATPGYAAYHWSPAYNISSVSASSVTVWPAKDTTYTVLAEINNHCTVTDSTRIKVLRTVPITIGNDTAFCQGGSVILQAPAGFEGYRWQDGSTAATYTAIQKGQYRLEALNSNGCYSKASVTVTDVFSLPPVNLGNDGKLCINNTTLHAGVGQQAYLWQNGTTDSVYIVNATGSYWVTVTGNHSCTNSDTIVVTGFNALPEGFLLPTASFCENGSVALTAIGRWPAYLWYNNSTASAVTVSQPGLYWLQVTDNNGCTARDSATVTLNTNCPKVIYFPNAFTPNGDGHNDIFKPFTGAPLEKYQLVIYNRWGQKIFDTTDPLSGWDGRINNAKLSTGAFVFVCRYKFYNEAEGVLKGTVLLLK